MPCFDWSHFVYSNDTKDLRRCDISDWIERADSVLLK